HIHFYPRQIGDPFENGPVDWRTRTPKMSELFVGRTRVVNLGRGRTEVPDRGGDGDTGTYQARRQPQGPGGTRHSRWHNHPSRECSELPEARAPDGGLW